MGKSHPTGQGGSHSYVDRGFDSYPTCAIAAESLFNKISFAGRRTWDPFSGLGGVGGVLRRLGVDVVCSDIVEREFPLNFVSDFFAMTAAPERCDAIVSNPPFRDAAQIIRRALTLVDDVIVLERLAFLESERREDLFAPGGGFAAVHVFRRRLPMMHRLNWAGNRATSQIAFAWFHWRRGHNGPAVVERI